MTMMTNLLLSFLLFIAQEEPSEAEALYDQGTVLYEAADYEGAIEEFTAALTLVGSDGDPRVKLMLLYNIASAHEKQYEIDEDRAHLRQALALYHKYHEFALSRGDLGEELDVEARIARIETMLEEPMGATEPAELLPPVPVPWEKPRRIGISLATVGSVAVLGGVVLTIAGARLEPRAQAQVAGLADLGLPPDHPAWAEGDAFVAQQRQQGTVMLGIGIPVAVVGAVGIGVGSYFITKSKRLRKNGVTIAPTFGHNTAGLQINGRF